MYEAQAQREAEEQNAREEQEQRELAENAEREKLELVFRKLELEIMVNDTNLTAAQRSTAEADLLTMEESERAIQKAQDDANALLLEK